MCSQIVSVFLVCVSLNFALFAENTIKIGASTLFKNWSKLALKTGPSMLRNKIGPVLTLELGHFLFMFFFFLKNPLISAGRTRFSKTKKTWTSFDTEKDKNWTSF